MSPSPPDDPLSTDSSELSTNGEKSATASISTNKTKKPKEKKEDPEVIRKWKEQQVRWLIKRQVLIICRIIIFFIAHFINWKILSDFQIKDLEKKDEAEEEAKLQLRALAKQELDDWYKQHAEQVMDAIIF